jgi:hypothetical protein
VFASCSRTARIVVGDDHFPLSKTPRGVSYTLDAANRLLWQLSFPAASTLLMPLLTQRACCRSSVSVHFICCPQGNVPITTCHLEQSSSPLPWYGLVLHPFPYFFSTRSFSEEGQYSMYVLLVSPFSADPDPQSISCIIPARLSNTHSLMPLFPPSMTASSVGCGVATSVLSSALLWLLISLNLQFSPSRLPSEGPT